MPSPSAFELKFSPYQRPRYIGLSRNQPGVPSLHNKVGSVTRKDTAIESKDGKQPEPRNKPLAEKRNTNSIESTSARVIEKRGTDRIVNKQLAKVKMVVAENAPPLSSSEDEGQSQGDAFKADPDPIMDSSDDGGPSRGDMLRTTFKSAQKQTAPQPAPPRPKRQAAQTTRTSARARSSQDSQPSSSASRRPPDGEDPEDPDELSEPSTNSRKRKSPDVLEAGRQLENSTWRSRQSAGYGSRAKKTKSEIKIPRGFSPKKPGESPKKSTVKEPKDLTKKNQGSPSPRKGLVIPRGFDKSPSKGSPEKKRIKPSPGQDELKVESPEAEYRPLKIPALFSTQLDMKDEECDNLKEDDESEMIETKEVCIIDSPKSSKTVCTMCDEEVDEKVRRKFDEKNPGSRFNFRREQKFCLFHKKQSAKETWKLKGYPEIDWKRLDKRIAKQHNFLQAILEGGDSYYGDVLKQSVKSGQNRTLLKSDQNMTPGYYGIRGLRVMTENLTYKFSRLLRERAVQDRLISSRGYMGYLQSVLVPELAVQLIKDDMSVSEEKAREIMAESSAVGELINEELKDVVRESDDEKD
ncbi:RTC4-like domain containing protein [Naviculisporaceae sp. PSN 640]